MSWLAGLRGRDAGDDADRWLLVITLLLLGAGLAMVLSASSVISLQRHGSPYYFFVRQVLFAGVGLAALAVLRRVDYHVLYRLAPAAAGAVGVLMVLVLVPHVGVQIQGARRWLDLGPLGTLQPSEAGQLAFALFMARWVDRR